MRNNFNLGPKAGTKFTCTSRVLQVLASNILRFSLLYSDMLSCDCDEACEVADNDKIGEDSFQESNHPLHKVVSLVNSTVGKRGLTPSG